jgi:hypothetical protein
MYSLPDILFRYFMFFFFNEQADRGFAAGAIFFLGGGKGGVSAKKGFQLLKLHYGFLRKKKSSAS